MRSPSSRNSDSVAGRARRRIGGVERERQPAPAAIFLEMRGIKLTLVEQIQLAVAIVGIEAAARHEFVDELVALIVARIDGHAPVARQRGRGAFRLAASERGALFRRPLRIVRIDFERPAIERRSVRVLRHVELCRCEPELVEHTA